MLHTSDAYCCLITSTCFINAACQSDQLSHIQGSVLNPDAAISASLLDRGILGSKGWTISDITSKPCSHGVGISISRYLYRTLSRYSGGRNDLHCMRIPAFSWSESPSTNHIPTLQLASSSIQAPYYSRHSRKKVSGTTNRTPSAGPEGLRSHLRAPEHSRSPAACR